MKHTLLAALAATALLSACGTMPSGNAAPIAEAAAARPAPSAADFVRMAAVSDEYEIQSSRLVLETTADPDLRRFAEMMIDHHTMTAATLARAARADGMAAPAPTLDAAKTDMIRQLQAATGPARDTLYRRQQVMAHREALTLHSSFAANGDARELKAAARTAVPIVAGHYNMILEMDGHSDMRHTM